MYSKPEAMDDNAKLLESLLVKVSDYGKTSFELEKLKALDKSSKVVSSLIPHTFGFVIIASSIFFINLGLAFWLGEILGKPVYGFFVVAAFYGFSGLIFYLFMKNWIKKLALNYFIKQVLK